MLKKIKKWWKKTLQSYREIYAETFPPFQNRHERRAKEKLKRTKTNNKT